MLKGNHVELPAMLAAREDRARRQARLRDEYHAPLLSFCLNIPGPVKTTPELRKLFDAAVSDIKKILDADGITILATDEQHADTGDELLLAAAGDAAEMKQHMTELEETHPLGRLFDIDIIDVDGQKLSRPVPRRCLLCSEQAQACASTRRPSVAELTAKIESMLDAWLAAQE